MGSFRVVFDWRAQQELMELYDYIHDESGAERAASFTTEIRDYCLGFATFPERGTLREDIAPGVRIVGFRKRVSIAFRISEEQVLILGIFYGGRNIQPGLLDD